MCNTNSMSLSEKSDEEIVDLVKSGDQEAFNILLDRYLEKIKRYGRRFVYNRNDLDDLVQDVFIKSYVNINSFDSGRKFSPWIYRIAHNEFVNAIRKKSYENLIPVDFDTFLPNLRATENPEDDFDFALRKQAVEECLVDLPGKYREIIVLYFFEEMDYKTIAEVLAIPVSTVGVRIKRAKDKLKKLLDKQHPQWSKN